MVWYGIEQVRPNFRPVRYISEQGVSASRWLDYSAGTDHQSRTTEWVSVFQFEKKSLQVGIPFAANSLWEDVIFYHLKSQTKIFGRHTRQSQIPVSPSGFICS